MDRINPIINQRFANAFTVINDLRANESVEHLAKMLKTSKPTIYRMLSKPNHRSNINKYIRLMRYAQGKSLEAEKVKEYI